MISGIHVHVHIYILVYTVEGIRYIEVSVHCDTLLADIHIVWAVLVPVYHKKLTYMGVSLLGDNMALCEEVRRCSMHWRHAENLL